MKLSLIFIKKIIFYFLDDEIKYREVTMFNGFYPRYDLEARIQHSKILPGRKHRGIPESL